MIEGLTIAMMVRNEAGRIGRTLASARAVAEQWLVIETASDDHIIDEIHQATTGWPGQLLHRPWQEFGYNRTELVALGPELTGTKWVLLLEPDHELCDYDQLAEQLATTTAAAIQLPYTSTPLQWVTRIVRPRYPWRFVGQTHMDLDCGGHVCTERWDSPRVIDHADASSRLERWQRDRELLDRQLTDDPSNPQAWFYLGDARRGLQSIGQAVSAYQQAALASGGGELEYVSLYFAGCLLASLEHYEHAIAHLRRANEVRPARREALLELCQILNDLARPVDVIHLLGTRPVDRPIPPADLDAIYPPAYSSDGELYQQQHRALSALRGLLDQGRAPGRADRGRSHRERTQ